MDGAPTLEQAKADFRTQWEAFKVANRELLVGKRRNRGLLSKKYLACPKNTSSLCD
jgi:hypothetical protein